MNQDTVQSGINNYQPSNGIPSLRYIYTISKE